jgi:DNA (cytosine-5)-methyltransferase 1
MKIAGLFAGIGGLEFGLDSAGHETILTCENWAPAQAVLANRFLGVRNHPDVTTLRSLPDDTEIVTAGFPCQDLSQAGKTSGIGGSRSGLVDHVFRLLDDNRAPWVLLENVSFMLHLEAGRAMARLVQEFEARGYRWAYRVINSLAFLPQRRERVFFLASLVADPADILMDDQDDCDPPKISTQLDTHAHGFYWTEGTRGLGWARDAVPTLKNGSTIGIPSPPAILLPDGRLIQPDIRDAERLQGFEPDWTSAALAVGRSSLRWSLVGNAVTVPVAAWIGDRLRNPGSYNRHRDRKQVASGTWPKAARSDGGRWVQVDIGTYPIWRPRRTLAEFLLYEGKPLSERATSGFLARARASRLRFEPGFLDRLDLHLETMRAKYQGMQPARTSRQMAYSGT